MKFAYATVIVLCLLASTSWSASNPLIRNCNVMYFNKYLGL
ncbi:MAG: hypothetical protein V4654_13645 [Bdellovibrionota bacterium]